MIRNVCMMCYLLMKRGAGEQAEQRVGDGALVQSQRQLRAGGAHHPQQPQHRDEGRARDQRRLHYQLHTQNILLLLCLSADSFKDDLYHYIYCDHGGTADIVIYTHVL